MERRAESTDGEVGNQLALSMSPCCKPETSNPKLAQSAMALYESDDSVES